MQLTIEVLPAPLGPMIENSSPSFTPKLTSASARTPPKRSDTPRTSKACSTHSLHWRLFRKAASDVSPGRDPNRRSRSRALWRSLFGGWRDHPGSSRRVNLFYPYLHVNGCACRRHPSALTQSTLVLDFSRVECYGLRREGKACPRSIWLGK